MTIHETGVEGLLLIKPDVFRDDRGYFFESYNDKEYPHQYTWVQDNEAFSTKGIVRGLHYQCGVHAQAKLVRVIKGEVLDVVVDLRKKSPTYGKIFSEILSGDNKSQLLIPRGFAHGYSVLSDEAIFAYKCDNFYNRESEGGISALDDQLDIDWLINKDDISLSPRDTALPIFGKHKDISI